jgi:hypothetical protein
LSEFFKSAIEAYCENSKGTPPEQIIVYRDGVGGPLFKEKVLKYEVEEIVRLIYSFGKGY